MSNEEEYSTVLKLDIDQQKVLVGLLREGLPETIVMHGMVKNIANKKWPYLEVFVDQWPNYHAVVIRARCGCDGFNGKFVSIQATDRDSIIKVLCHPGVIDWTKELAFDIPPAFKDVLTDIKPESARLETRYHGQNFVVNPRTMKFSFNIKEPGITVSEIRQEDVPLVAKNWIQDPDMHLFLTRLVNLNLPSVCLRSETGQPVAYALSYIYDVITMLHVIPTHRRKGLAQAVISYLVEKKFKEDEEFIGAQIRYDNEASRRMFYGCGFECLPKENDFLVIWYYPPK